MTVIQVYLEATLTDTIIHMKKTLKLHLYFFEPYAAYTIMSAKWVFTNWSRKVVTNSQPLISIVVPDHT